MIALHENMKSVNTAVKHELISRKIRRNMALVHNHTLFFGAKHGR